MHCQSAVALKKKEEEGRRMTFKGKLLLAKGLQGLSQLGWTHA